MPNVKGVDNRGTEEVPYGYVYVDNTRVGFSQSDGVWYTNGWGATETQRRAAKAHLDQIMPGWNDKKEKADG